VVDRQYEPVQLSSASVDIARRSLDSTRCVAHLAVPVFQGTGQNVGVVTEDVRQDVDEVGLLETGVGYSPFQTMRGSKRFRT